MAITVRPAISSDIGWLLTQLRAFDQFAGHKRSLLGSEDHCRAGLLGLIERHVVLIAEDGDGAAPHRLGFIAGYATPHPFNPSFPILTEAFWWVADFARFSRAGVLLLDAFTDHGKKLGGWVVMTLEHHSPVKDRHLTSRGYALKERSFLLEV